MVLLDEVLVVRFMVATLLHHSDGIEPLLLVPTPSEVLFPSFAATCIIHGKPHFGIISGILRDINEVSSGISGMVTN